MPPRSLDTAASSTFLAVWDKLRTFIWIRRFGGCTTLPQSTTVAPAAPAAPAAPVPSTHLAAMRSLTSEVASDARAGLFLVVLRSGVHRTDTLFEASRSPTRGRQQVWFWSSKWTGT